MALDTAKAFDRVFHSGLLHVKGYGIPSRILDVIQLVLTNWVMKIVLDSHASRLFHIKAMIL